MHSNWEKFWKAWRNEAAENEEDLYLQVAKTIHSKPIEKRIFDLINKNISDILALGADDIFVELCCGNGLCTYEFKDKVKQIVAVDFALHLIEAANKFKSAPNIQYNLGSVFTFLDEFKSNWNYTPAKYLMNDSLAYFTPGELHRILSSILELSGNNFIFLVRGVPNDKLKWNFYNTEDRKARYYENQKKADNTNDGLGRWWMPEELEQTSASLGLKCVIQNQPEEISNYRMDVQISTKDFFKQ
jgi:predicted TPR repeat methyltransferase